MEEVVRGLVLWLVQVLAVYGLILVGFYTLLHRYRRRSLPQDSPQPATQPRGFRSSAGASSGR